jgi:biopolymer transport protein ExbB
VLVYHFAAQPPTDSSAAGNNAENGGVAVPGAMIGSGLRLDGQTSIQVPASPTLAWTAGGGAGLATWLKPVVDQPSAVILSRRDGANSFVLGIENGVPYLEIKNGAATQKTGAGEPIAAGTWRHLAVSVDGGTATLLLDGETYGTIPSSLPAFTGGITLGGEVDAGDTQFIGEIDELQVENAAMPLGKAKFLAVNGGGSAAAQKLLAAGESEVSGHAAGGHSGALEHVMLFGDIAGDMMFDGWIAVGVCVLMMVFGWTVAFQKYNYLNRIQKGTEAFMQHWAKVSTDLTAIDREGGIMADVSTKMSKLMHKSPVYHLYHIGSEEIRHRLGNGNRHKGLSARSIQAIRASLETGMVHENHRMNKGLIYLTISIAGGPYVGLLGTVVGVMITFAIIAKSGEVDVNSIAPGIASALLATVFGLLVAIPALFIYSFLSSRIRDLLASMQVFNDEFVAKMAEFYPTPTPTVVPVPTIERTAPASAHADVARASDH